jgi:phage repressor protein C with HTH and peptisase S24 domain
MNAKEIGEAVAEGLARKRMSQEDLAELLGIGQSTMSRIVRGEFKRMPSEMTRICAVLEIPVPELDGKGGPAAPAPGLIVPQSRFSVPDFKIYAAAQGGPGEIIVHTEPVDVVMRPLELMHVKDAYGLLITGTSMIPEFRPGETAHVNPRLPPVGGEVHIFYAEKEGTARASIKELRKATGTDWHVTQHNPEGRQPKDFTLPRKEWRWVHRVVGKRARQ